tara:strand:+ start:1199 stop:1645 length:447 start_codon:yes stop_codon:yes gene_type:complete
MAWFNELKNRQLIQPKKLRVGISPLNGYGVWATEDIQQGEVVEESPFWVSGIPSKKMNVQMAQICYNWGCDCSDMGLGTYCECPSDGPYALIASGYIQLYNHGDDPDVHFEYNKRRRYITVKARKFIPAGKEVFHTYGKKYNNFGEVQ